jgi:hypothetical protein
MAGQQWLVAYYLAVPDLLTDYTQIHKMVEDPKRVVLNHQQQDL